MLWNPARRQNKTVPAVLNASHLQAEFQPELYGTLHPRSGRTPEEVHKIEVKMGSLEDTREEQPTTWKSACSLRTDSTSDRRAACRKPSSSSRLKRVSVR